MVMRDNDVFTKWILGLSASMAVAALTASLAFGLRVEGSIATLLEKSEGQSRQINDLKTQLVGLATDRYTGEQASRDRDGLLRVVGSNTEQIGKMTDKIIQMSERLHVLEAEKR